MLNRMIDPSKMSTNELKGQILFLLACCGYIRKSSLTYLQDSKPYVSKVLAEMKSKKMISISSKSPYDIHLLKAGIEAIKECDIAIYNHYMAISNNNHLGRTLVHRDVAVRAADVLIQMLKVQIDIGPQKPTLSYLMNHPESKMNIQRRTFYLNRELRYQDDQKEARIYVSRVTGILFSRGITATVYCCPTESIEISSRIERSTSIRVVRQRKDLYKNISTIDKTRSIIFCRSDKDAITIMSETVNTSSGMISIGNAIKNPSLIGTEFCYIPMNENGCKSLDLITTFKSEEINVMLFNDEEIRLAKQNKMGDAIKGNTICFEFLSCNVSKLSCIKRNFNDLSDVLIFCREYQVDFIFDYFEHTPKLRVEIVPDAEIYKYYEVIGQKYYGQEMNEKGD